MMFTELYLNDKKIEKGDYDLQSHKNLLYELQSVIECSHDDFAQEYEKFMTNILDVQGKGFYSYLEYTFKLPFFNCTPVKNPNGYRINAIHLLRSTTGKGFIYGRFSNNLFIYSNVEGGILFAKVNPDIVKDFKSRMNSILSSARIRRIPHLDHV